MSSLARLLLKTRELISPTVVTKAKTLTTAEATYGVIVANVNATATVTFVLPPAVPGMRVMAVVKAAFELRIDPFGTQTISLPSTGVQGAAGKFITADALSESVELFCIVAGTWDSFGATDGIWAAEA